MTRNKLFIALVFVVVVGCVSAGISQLKAPVPPHVTIIPPDPSLPEELKALSGKWAGEWNSRWGWDCVLYVERVDKDSAQVVHSWGEYTTGKQSCHCTPNWTRVEKARVIYSEGRAELEFKARPYHRMKESAHNVSGSAREGAGSRYTFSFTVEKDKPDVLNGHFISGKGSQLRTEMKRIE